MVVLTAVLLSGPLRDIRLAILSAAMLPLVPQWGAAMTMAGNDAAATLLATVATFGVLRLTRGDARASVAMAMVTGASLGLALGAKLTTAFLLPMAGVALLSPPVRGRAGRLAAWMAAGALAPVVLVFGRNLWVFGDPLAREFKRALLQQSGFVALAERQPGIADPAFWSGVYAHVFEAFWARFGSLGAGPPPESRVWWMYAAVSVALSIFVLTGARVPRHRQPRDTDGPGPHPWEVLVTTCGVLIALLGWIVMNVTQPADAIVHWTPRHLLPASAPCLLLAAVGAERWFPNTGPAPFRRAATVLCVLALALGWLVSLQYAMAQFYLGYS
jgi:4-amino-4-deoxy-L-arabinose transferase-like glycosyltransferase